MEKVKMEEIKERYSVKLFTYLSFAFFATINIALIINGVVPALATVALGFTFIAALTSIWNIDLGLALFLPLFISMPFIYLYLEPKTAIVVLIAYIVYAVVAKTVGRIVDRLVSSQKKQ